MKKMTFIVINEGDILNDFSGAFSGKVVFNVPAEGMAYDKTSPTAKLTLEQKIERVKDLLFTLYYNGNELKVFTADEYKALGYKIKDALNVVW